MAAAHSMLIAIYYMLPDGTHYEELGGNAIGMSTTATMSSAAPLIGSNNWATPSLSRGLRR
jgi:hypothetical protein